MREIMLCEYGYACSLHPMHRGCYNIGETIHDSQFTIHGL